MNCNIVGRPPPTRPQKFYSDVTAWCQSVRQLRLEPETHTSSWLLGEKKTTKKKCVQCQILYLGTNTHLIHQRHKEKKLPWALNTMLTFTLWNWNMKKTSLILNTVRSKGILTIRLIVISDPLWAYRPKPKHKLLTGVCQLHGSRATARVVHERVCKMTAL